MNKSVSGNPDPYRTPGEIPDAPEVAKRGLFRSPLTWIFVAAVAGAMFFFVGFSRTSVEEFGESRGGPPREELPEMDAYEAEMAAYEVEMAAE